MGLDGGGSEVDFPPPSSVISCLTFPVPRSAGGFLTSPPTEGALAAALGSVAVEQCVMQLGTGGGRAVEEWPV